MFFMHVKTLSARRWEDGMGRSGPAIRPYLPPPLELSGNIFLIIFFELQKEFFFLSGQAFTPLPPPLLVAGPLKNKPFLRLP